MPKVLAVGGVRRIRAENGMLLPATIGVRSFFFKSRIFCDHGISVVVVVGCGSVFVLSDGSGGIGDVVKSLVEADVSNGCEGSDVSQLVAKMPAKSRDNTIKIEAIRRTECDLRREMFDLQNRARLVHLLSKYEKITRRARFHLRDQALLNAFDEWFLSLF
jgi:hypothetical protein